MHVSIRIKGYLDASLWLDLPHRVAICKGLRVEESESMPVSRWGSFMLVWVAGAISGVLVKEKH